MRHLPLAFALSRSAACHASTPPKAAPPAPALDAGEASIAQLQQRITAGTLTSRQLTQAYLDRIAAIDDAGPRLNAVIETNPAALQEADAPASCAARCTASRSCSRTTSTRCRWSIPPARLHWPPIARAPTPSTSPGCARPAR